MLEEQPLQTEQVARRYSVKAITVRDWLRKGILDGNHINSEWYITWDAIFEFEGRLGKLKGGIRDEAKIDLVTVESLAQRYHKNPETIRAWCRRGFLPARRIMSRWYVDPLSVAQFERALRSQN